MSYQKYKNEVLKDPRSEKLNFEPDDRNHYVYRVSHKDIKIHYYGSKSEKPGVTEDTIGYDYFTSSDYLEKAFKANPEDYKVKVIRHFDNPGDKILFESYLHQKLDVKLRYNFINQANQTPFGFDRTGKKFKQKTINKMIVMAIKNHAEIKADPKRYNERAKNKSAAAIIFHQKLKKDLVKSEKRSKALSEAALSQQEELRGDPVKRENISRKQSTAHLINSEINKLDPEKQSKKYNSRRNVIYQYDLDGNFLKKFSSQKAAASELGYPNASGIGNCLNGRQLTCGNCIWKKYKIKKGSVQWPN